MKHKEARGGSKDWGLVSFPIGLPQILPYSRGFREADRLPIQVHCIVT